MYIKAEFGKVFKNGLLCGILLFWIASVLYANEIGEKNEGIKNATKPVVI